VAGRPPLTGLRIADDPQAWARLGFAVSAGGSLRLGATTIELAGEDDERGIVGWSVDGLEGTAIDGLPAVATASHGNPPGSHPTGAVALDHVVVVTPSLDRTLGALQAAGLDLRRVREARAEPPLRQGFFKLGDVVLEVTGPAGADPWLPPGEDVSGPARFWGLVAVVPDLDRLVASSGGSIGAPRDAVQPGRRIATVRGEAGVSTALAFMTPDPRRG
jgi:hypothetical protein